MTDEERREKARLRSQRWRWAHGIMPRRPALFRQKEPSPMGSCRCVTSGWRRRAPAKVCKIRRLSYSRADNCRCLAMAAAYGSATADVAAIIAAAASDNEFHFGPLICERHRSLFNWRIGPLQSLGSLSPAADLATCFHAQILAVALTQQAPDR